MTGTVTSDTDPTGSTEQIRSARMVLGWLIEPGSKHLHQLVARYGPVETLALLTDGRSGGGLAAVAATRLNGLDPAHVAEQLREQATRLGVHIVTPEDEEWPASLDDLTRISVEDREPVERDTYPPQCLWVRGPFPLDEAVSRSVALVGARACTPYGAHVAAELAYGLADQGWTVLSGGAYGIDAVAHRGALAASGLTVAVLACGVDQAYPPSNTALFEQIADEGLLISEWPPGTAPYKLRFLVRNRVIAALTRGTVLVEASARSGARQTLRRAKQLGRPLMVVPGPVTSEASVGCHEELRRVGDEQPVRLVTSVAQVLEEVGPIGQLAPAARGPVQPHDSLDRLEQQIMDGVPRRGGADPGTIAANAGVSLREALAKLPSLALRGHLREHTAGYARPLAGKRRSP